MEKEIMKKMLIEGILELQKIPNDKLTIQQLNYKINITKIIFSLIYERNEQFIDFLQQDSLKVTYEEFLNLLFLESCKILDMPITLQLDWVE